MMTRDFWLAEVTRILRRHLPETEAEPLIEFAGRVAASAADDGRPATLELVREGQIFTSVRWNGVLLPGRIGDANLTAAHPNFWLRCEFGPDTEILIHQKPPK